MPPKTWAWLALPVAVLAISANANAQTADAQSADAQTVDAQTTEAPPAGPTLDECDAARGRVTVDDSASHEGGSAGQVAILAERSRNILLINEMVGLELGRVRFDLACLAALQREGSHLVEDPSVLVPMSAERFVTNVDAFVQTTPRAVQNWQLRSPTAPVQLSRERTPLAEVPILGTVIGLTGRALSMVRPDNLFRFGRLLVDPDSIVAGSVNLSTVGYYPFMSPHRCQFGSDPAVDGQDRENVYQHRLGMDSRCARELIRAANNLEIVSDAEMDLHRDARGASIVRSLGISGVEVADSGRAVAAR